MTNKTWHKYSERKPTFDDGRRGFVLRSASVAPFVVHWSDTYNTGHWRRLEDDDFPPTERTERKLRPAWQPIDADTGYKNGDYILNPPPRGKADI